jgi:hypothetical protein
MPERNSDRDIKKRCLKEMTEKKKNIEEKKLMDNKGYEE